MSVFMFAQSKIRHTHLLPGMLLLGHSRKIPMAGLDDS